MPALPRHRAAFVASPMETPDPQNWLAAALGGAAACLGAFAALRRRMSRDRTEIVKDRAEADIVARLVIERDAAVTEAKRVMSQRVADAETIARLVAENEDLNREVHRLLGSIRKMVRELPPEMRRVMATDFQPLGPPEK